MMTLPLLHLHLDRPEEASDELDAAVQRPQTGGGNGGGIELTNSKWQCVKTPDNSRTFL